MKESQSDAAGAAVPQFRPVVMAGAALAVLIIAAYAPVRHFDFVNYDDHRYITHNPHVQQGLTLDTIAWAFTTFEVGNWHPLAWLSHMTEVTMFGAGAPGAHHMVNVALHVLNAIFVLVLLNHMTGSLWRSAAVAALFALHPLRVESVAWISERKDVLNVFFGLLAMLAYVRYARRRKPGWYALVAIAFACSLMSKPMLVTLPFVLLLLDYWPLQRLTANESRAWLRLGLEKVPLILMSFVSSVITVFAQTSGGSVSTLDELPPAARIMNAAAAYGIYLWQTIRPVNLAPLYPLRDHWPLWIWAGSAAALIIISALIVARRRTSPAVLTGWFWWLGALVPVIGLVQVGSQAHADRYTYFPHIGLFIMLAWSLPAASTRAMKAIYASIGACILIVLFILTRFQTTHWRDSIALSEHTLRVTRDNGYAHFNLGNALTERGRLDEAVIHFRAAADLKPRWGDAPYNLGNAHLSLQEFDQAIAAYDEAIRRDPANVAAHVNRAIALARLGDTDAAIESFEQALKIDPADRAALVNYGQTLARLERMDEAIFMFERALTVNPNDGFAHVMLGNALARLDRLNEAVPHFAEALRLNPENPHAHMSMAAALAGQGHITPAIAHLRAADEIARSIRDDALRREIESRIERYQNLITP